MTRPGALVLPALAVAGALGFAVFGAFLTTDPASGVNTAVEGLSSGSSGLVGELANLLPLGFAFAAGMVSAVNPCGFVLLPAYVGVFLGEGDGQSVGTGGRVRRGLVVGGTLTVGFVLLFAVIGLLIGSVARVLVDALPWLGLGVGVALVVAGGYRLAGGALYSALPERLSGRLTGGLSGSDPPGLRSYFVFGLAYGVASLSCTLPIFLAVLGGSLATADLGPAFGRLVLYGLGMGSLILGVTLVAALFKAAALRRLRGTMRYVEPVGTLLLFLAGSYVVYYWLTIGGLLT
jgi:cytochrome c biogenesis protein CcdA